MRQLGSIIDSRDMSLWEILKNRKDSEEQGRFWEILKNREALHAAVHGVTKSQT